MKHGRVAIIAHDNVECFPLPLDHFCIEQHAEFCAIEIRKIKTVLIISYRSSLSREFELYFDKVEELLSSITGRYKHIILAGDFNINIKDKNAN